jgi:hypothetical protein
MNITADIILSYAKKNKITLKRGAVFPAKLTQPLSLCARNVVEHMAIEGEPNYKNHDFVLRHQKVLEKFSMDTKDLIALECGFEDFGVVDTNNPYYAVGKEVYEKSIAGK